MIVRNLSSMVPTYDPFNRICDLIDEVSGGHLQTGYHRRLILFLITQNLLTATGSKCDMLIVNDDRNLVSKLVANFSGVVPYTNDFELFDSFKTMNSKHIEGGTYKIQRAGMLKVARGSLYFEHFDSLKPAEIERLMVVNRSCGIIACCGPIHARKLTQKIYCFDLIIGDKNRNDHTSTMEECQFVLNLIQGSVVSRKQNLSVSPDSVELTFYCEAALKEYFIESRNVIGEYNETSIFPIYDPARQLSFGIALAKAFSSLRGGCRTSKHDVLMSMLIQDLCLKERLGSSVFEATDAFQDYDSVQSTVMPSPCPSNSMHDAQIPVPSRSPFNCRYSDVILALKAQLRL